MEKARQIVAVMLAIALASATLAACGGDQDSGGDDGPAPGSASAPAEAPGGAPSGEERGGQGADEGQDASDPPQAPAAPPPAAEAAAERDSGGGSEQFKVRGGDNSIQDFGEEASESERHAAAVVLHAFLQARAKEQWAAACAYLAGSVLDQLRTLASRMEGDPEGCPETLGVLSPPVSGAAEEELIEANVGSLRVEGERAFILYRGAGGVDYTITMDEEAGDWKVAALAPIPLS